ncbi:uncharacterized protein LOC141907231 [Tubulanus polymorphus]|uniref:uncharacterized protein LOC141907231 n=1 Tax=Tubulanus polymorphus TaxID=672921 RepID=UPI003DA37269
MHIRMGLVVPSIIGNCLALAVMTMKKNRASSICFLMANLAFVDNIPLLSYLHNYLWAARIHDTNTHPFYCQLGVFLGSFGVTTAAWLVAFMTIERSIATLFPLKAMRICRMRNVKISVVVLYGVMVARFFHYFFVFTTGIDVLSGWNTCIGSELFTATVRFVDTVVKLAFDTVGPCAIVFMCNVLIIASIRKRRTSDGHLGAKGKDSFSETQITRTLLLVSITFTILVSPFTIKLVYNSIYPKLKRTNCATFTFHGTIEKILHDMLYVNHGINFLLYCVGGGKRFRNDLSMYVKPVKQNTIVVIRDGKYTLALEMLL